MVTATHHMLLNTVLSFFNQNINKKRTLRLAITFHKYTDLHTFNLLVNYVSTEKLKWLTVDKHSELKLTKSV